MTRTLVDTLTTDENGEASYTYTGEGAGEIGFVAEYEDTSSNTVTIDDYIPAVTSIDISSNVYSINYGGSITLTANVKDQHNQPMAGETVTFKNGNVTLGTGTTNGNGIATLTKSNLDAGTYSITAESTVSSTAITVTVNKLNTTLSISVPALIYSDEFDVTGVLTDSNDNAISNATVSIIWDDGESHTSTAVTNSNGEVTFHREAPTTITEYSFQLRYEASTNYNASHSSSIMRTVGKETSVLNVSTPISGSAITGSSFNVAGTLKDNDNTAISNKSVQVLLGATTLTTLTTDNNGGFSGTISSSGLSGGSNTLNFVFAGDTYYTSVNQQVIVNKTSFDGITIDSDKDILSAADHEYATLTAQLTNSGSAISLAGETVTFEVRKQSDNTLIETLTSDTTSSGIASVSYYGKGAGDLNIRAFCGSVYSDTYPVADRFYYDTCTSDKRHWDTSQKGNATVLFEERGLVFANSPDSTNRFLILDLDYPSTYSVEYTIVSLYPSNNNCGEGLLEGISTIINNSKTCVYNIDDWSSRYETSPMLSANDVVKYVFDGSNVSVYLNGTLLTTKSRNSNYTGFRLKAYKGRNIVLKNISIEEI